MARPRNDMDGSPRGAVGGHRAGHGWEWTPPGGPPALSQLRTIRFRDALYGYHRDDVHDYLRRAADEADAIVSDLVHDGASDRAAPALPVLSDIRTVVFRVVIKGYNRAEVDHYLENAARDVESLLGEALVSPPAGLPGIPLVVPEAWPTSAAVAATASAASAAWPTCWAPGAALPDPGPPSRPIRWVLSVMWALLPLLSLGLLAAPCVLYATIRLRSHRLGVFTVFYATVTAVALALGDSPFDSWQSSAAATIFFCTGVICTAHCFAILRPVVARERERPGDWRRELS